MKKTLALLSLAVLLTASTTQRVKAPICATDSNGVRYCCELGCGAGYCCWAVPKPPPAKP